MESKETLKKDSERICCIIEGNITLLNTEGNITLLNTAQKQRRVMFKFDDDEPMPLNSISESGEFIIKLKEGKVKFEKGGKSFELYVE